MNMQPYGQWFYEVSLEVDDLALGDPSILGIGLLFDQNDDWCPISCVVYSSAALIGDDTHAGPYGTIESRRATVAHELGHLFLLRHESVNADETVQYNCGFDNTGAIPHSVMAYDCISPVSVGGLGEYTVQPWDVCGINHKFPSSYSTAGCPAKQKKLFPCTGHRPTCRPARPGSTGATPVPRWNTPVSQAITDWNTRPDANGRPAEQAASASLRSKHRCR
jgi:hypothetical protein